jgi:hypothetical protein
MYTPAVTMVAAWISADTGFEEGLCGLGGSRRCQQQLALGSTKGDDRHAIAVAIHVTQQAEENAFHLCHALIGGHGATRVHD